MQKFSRFFGGILLIAFTSCSTISPMDVRIQNLPVNKASQLSASQRLQIPPNYLPQQANPIPYKQFEQFNQTIAFWTGDGGKGKSITILPPRAIGLAENQAYLPDLIANELVSNFNNYSDMTLFDRVNNQRQYDELLSGYYSDDDAAGMDLGNLASTDYMLLGSITRTTTGYALQLTINRNSDKTTVASYSGAVSIIDLDNLTGVRRASLDLLPKMGVQLTAQARTELSKAATIDHISAMTAMAQGINAQRQGTEVAALTYFFQAAAFDASLVEAVSRTNILSTNISTGNIGANVRNDIAWRRDWVNKLTETETFINEMLRNTTTQRSIWYTTNVQEQESARDYNRETTELRIEAALHTHAVFPVSVQRTVQAVYDGLQTTQRAQAWGLNNWPRQGVTNTNPFNNRWGGNVSISFELINERNQVIGRQTVEMDSRFSFNGTRLDGPGTSFTTVRFTGVNANNITDHLNIRITSINGQLPEQAGISRIEPITAQQMSANKAFTIYNGAIRPSSNDRNLGTVTIPDELWGERVTVIPDGAFERRGITSVTIPEGIINIGDRAFADNHWTTNERQSDGTSYARHHGLTIISIPSSVNSIGQEAFYSHWTTSYYNSNQGRYVTFNHYLVTEVTIGANVNLGINAIGGNFNTFYNNSSKQAGVYTRRYNISTAFDAFNLHFYTVLSDGFISENSNWIRFNNRTEMQEIIKTRNEKNAIREKRSNALGVIATIGFLGLLVLAYQQGWLGEKSE